jgi:hypothetical protein
LFPRFYYLHPLLLIHMPFCTNTSSSPFEVRHVRFSYDKPVLKVPCTCAVRFEDLVVVRLTILSGWYLCCVLACTVSQPRWRWHFYQNIRSHSPDLNRSLLPYLLAVSKFHDDLNRILRTVAELMSFVNSCAVNTSLWEKLRSFVKICAVNISLWEKLTSFVKNCAVNTSLWDKLMSFVKSCAVNTLLWEKAISFFACVFYIYIRFGTRLNYYSHCSQKYIENLKFCESRRS